MGRVEVIVVDNGSRALPRDVVAAFPGVILADGVRRPGPGTRATAAWRWRARRWSPSPIPTAPWRPTGWRHPRPLRRPALEILGGEIHMTTEVAGEPTAAEAFDCVYGFDQRDYIERQGFAVTANMAARAALRHRRPLRRHRGRRGLDWGQRAAALGHRTATPPVVVFHPGAPLDGRARAKWDRNVSHHYRVRAQGSRGG